MREIASLAELKTLVGQEVAVSDWVEKTCPFAASSCRSST